MLIQNYHFDGENRFSELDFKKFVSFAWRPLVKLKICLHFCFLKLLIISVFIVLSLNVRSEKHDAELLDLSLEELLKVTVTTASKSEKTLAKTPASVSIIYKAQIKANGWRSLADILNAQTGFYVFSDRIYDFVVPRGNYQTNDPNSRILLLLNGHSVIESFGYFNGHLPTVDVNHIERVEIVRGPGSVIYGTNAMFAVINVITQKVVADEQISFTAESGNHGYQKLSIRGDWLLPDGYISILTSALTDNENSLFFPEYVGSLHEGQGATPESADRQKATNFYIDLNVASWSVSTFYNHRTKNVPTGLFGGSIDQGQTFFEDTNTFFEIKRQFSASENTTATIRGFYDDYEFKGRFYYLQDINGITGPPYSSEFNRVTDSSFGFESYFDTNLAQGSDLVYGIEYKKYGDVDFIYVSENDPLQLLNERFSFDPEESITSIFVSWQKDFNEYWDSVLGVHYDYYETVGGHLSLRASLGYRLSERSHLKFIYGEAFRAPNSWELNGGFFLVGNPDLDPETSQSFEALFDYSITDSWHWLSSLYHYQTDNSIRQSSSGFEFINSAGVEGFGLESEVRYSKGENSGYLSFSLSDVEDRRFSQRISFTPESLIKLGFTRRFYDSFLLHLESQWVSDRLLADPNQGKVSQFSVTNLTLSNLAINEKLRISFSIDNLFNESYQHPSFLSDLATFNINRTHPVFDIPADERTYALKIEARW